MQQVISGGNGKLDLTPLLSPRSQLRARSSGQVSREDYLGLRLVC